MMRRSNRRDMGISAILFRGRARLRPSRFFSRSVGSAGASPSHIAILFFLLLSRAALADVDPSTLTGKVMCGYQGWFAAPGDGLGRGWYHWSMDPARFEPGHCKIDLWPDLSELDADERYATAFKLADGRAAEVYSAQNAKTVLRHFKWMRDYG